MLCRKMPIKILSRAICQTWVFWEATTRKGKFPRSSTTGVEKMVAIRLLTPGCRGTAPELAAWIRLCPSSHRARELFLVCVCWCLGCARNPAGTVPLGHIICLCQLGRDERLQQDNPPHCMEVLRWFLFVLVPQTRLNVGEMNISARTNCENPVPALVRHRRKKGLGVGFSQSIFFYFSYFNKCVF